MEAEKNFSEKDSLKLIAEMIAQAKAGYYHDSGVGALLWGTVVSIAGFLTFFDLYFQWNTGFDWWLLALFAIIPQVYISYRERKAKLVQTHVGRALDVVWAAFGISIFAVIFYMHQAPATSMQFLLEDGFTLAKQNLDTGETEPFQLSTAPSPGSLLLLMYAFPTIVTGVAQKFKPMVFGALLTYLLFVVSLYTRSSVDNLFMGVAGLVNWLIPGLLLNAKYKKSKKGSHV